MTKSLLRLSSERAPMTNYNITSTFSGCSCVEGQRPVDIEIVMIPLNFLFLRMLRHEGSLPLISQTQIDYTSLSLQIIGESKKVDFPGVLSLQRKALAVFMKNEAHGTIKSGDLSADPDTKFSLHSVQFLQDCKVGAQNVNLSTKKFKDFVVSSYVGTDEEVKVRVDVSGARTQEIFDNVFAKLVEAAQPIPGFRRVKGGKTPDIPKDVLLHIIGPSKVNKETILSVINTTVAEFVEKEGLDVSRDLRVEQSYDDIEATFSPGKEFSFEAIVRRKRTSKS